MTSTPNKRQKISAASANESAEAKELNSNVLVVGLSEQSRRKGSVQKTTGENNDFGMELGDLSDDSDSAEDDDDDDLDEDDLNDSDQRDNSHQSNHLDIQEQLAAAGPAGVAAAAAIASARRRKRSHQFETNPSVRKRQQTRLIRKLRACIDEYTMRVGQQAVVLITMPGKTVNNFKVFGAQPLESVIRACKQDIMAELEQALLEQAPQQFKDDSNKHELPPLVIDGIPTPVEKMTQAQLRAFIPLMLKYSTGRGKPGWGKESTRPPWWPETLPWANVRSDARDDNEKQRISWTTTLRQIVTNCYKFHGRDDLLPTFDESEESARQQAEQEAAAGTRRANSASNSHLGRPVTRLKSELSATNSSTIGYSTGQAYASNFVQTIANGDGTVSLIQVDPANAQILTLPDGTQVRAVRLQTLAGDSSFAGQQMSGELHEAVEIDPQTGERSQQQQHALAVGEATLASDGQIIVTGEDGTQSCYPMSQLVSIPASMYQQFAQGGQQLSIVSADGSSIAANAVSIHAIQEGGQLQEISIQQVHEDALEPQHKDSADADSKRDQRTSQLEAGDSFELGNDSATPATNI